MKSFREDDAARVPLAVIGVLFVLISAAVSMNLSRIDSQMAASLSAGDQVDTADTALLYARADLARAINYAGMEAVKQMGETPVIEIDPGSQYNPGGAVPDVAEFNRNWARGMINHTLNQYIEANYMYNVYRYGGYAVNVEPVRQWDNIRIEPIYMALDRKLETPVLPPHRTYETYWKVTVPLNVSVSSVITGDVVDEQAIEVGTLITSRYPLLESMTGEYEDRLNGASAVMSETTAFALAYTWARGYLQYYKGDPGNIVANEHLGLIVNGALLMDQGFVFNSVDPASILEYALQSKRILGKKDIDRAEMLKSMKLKDGSYEVDPQADAAGSTGEPGNASEALDQARKLDYNATPVTEFLNNESLPDGTIVSKQIEAVIKQVYSATLATGVARQKTVKSGDHAGYESSHQIGDWGSPVSTSKVGTVPRDTYVPGNLFGEIWEAQWTREHVWRHYYVVEYDCKKTRTVRVRGSDGNWTTYKEEYWTTCYRTEYSEMTTTDTRVDRVTVTLKAKENSRTSIPMAYAGTTLSTKNDVNKAFTSRDVELGQTYTDPLLEAAYNDYKNKYLTDANIERYVTDLDLSGEIKVRTYSSQDLPVPGWLEAEAQSAVDEITLQIREDIHLSPTINYEKYPNPADAMRATAKDLISKVKNKRGTYIDKSRYTVNGKYSSTSAKAIAQVREWYVDQVMYRINEKYLGAAKQIDDEIDEEFGDEADGVREANNNAVELLKSAISLPIGLTMKAEHVRPDGSGFGQDDIAYWAEDVTLAVDMDPDYLMEESGGGKKLINLGVQNVCLFGPTGIPVLLPPNYVVQFNGWAINVEGRIDEFVLQDVDDEVHPNFVFGHEAQVYRREDDKIIDPTTNMPIGDNIPINFKFTTGTFIAVPPTGKPIGDREGYDLYPKLPFSETSSKFGKIIR